MSKKPPIIAYHIIFGAYGFWLPNDPRGSWSRYVYADRLRPFGEPQRRARHEPIAAEESLRAVMKEDLAYPPVRLMENQVLAVGRGFAEAVQQGGYVVYAAAIMPEHVHLVVARQQLHAEEMMGHFKRAATRKLREEGLHPMSQYLDQRGRFPSPWERNGWKVYLHSPDEIEMAMIYVNNNPLEAGLPAQTWRWVQPMF